MSSKKHPTGMQLLQNEIDRLTAACKCEWCDELSPYKASRNGKYLGQACAEHLHLLIAKHALNKPQAGVISTTLESKKEPG